MNSFDEQMAKFETITTLDDEMMQTIWQAQCDHVIALMAKYRDPENWSDSTIDYLPDAMCLAASMYCEAHEGPMITLEYLRIHIAHACCCDWSWEVVGRLFNSYDEMEDLGDATRHMLTDRWEPGVLRTTSIDMKALPTD